jgi:F-type H+-transporting ATPase subunit delta
MNISKVAKRYANSLLENSIEKGILENVSKDVEFILHTLEISSELKRFLSSPVIKSDLKKSILKEIFENRISHFTSDFLNFVVDKKREDILLNILEKFIELKDDYQGIVRLEIKSAFALDDNLSKLIIKKFEEIFNKKVEAKFILDVNLLGGFVARYKDTVYDASIIHQLEKLKNNLISGTISLN